MLEVNKPLNIDGTTVHLIGHGYAAKVTVKDAERQRRLLRTGRVAAAGRQLHLGGGDQGARRPTGTARLRGLLHADGGDRSSTDRGRSSPTRSNPALFINAWSGPPKVETGKPENVYSLDTTGLTQLREKNGEPSAAGCTAGDGVDLPDGKGSIQLDGWSAVGQAADRRRPGRADLDRRHRVRGRGPVPVAVRPAAPGVGCAAQPRGWS